MARTQISIKIDDELLTRVDRLAEATGETRTSIIEQAVRQDISEQEWYHHSLENPIVRALHEKLSSPSMLRRMMSLAGTEITEESVERVKNRGERSRVAAKVRSKQKRRQTKDNSENT